MIRKGLFLFQVLALMTPVVLMAEEPIKPSSEQGTRTIASDQQVFTQDYLESIKDEEAGEALKKEKLAREHDKYLHHLDRTAR